MENGSKMKLFQKNHIKIMKVALAIAILHQKPASVSAAEFTLHLSRQLKQDEINWKLKVGELEGQLLRMQQELVKCRLSQEVTVVPGDAGAHQVLTQKADWTRDASDMEWHSSGHSSLKTQSSGRNKKESYHDEDTSGKNWPEICHDLCARGGSYLEDGGLLDMSVETRESGREERIRSHVKFLISTSTMASIHSRLPAVLSMQLQSSLRDTLLETIRGLKESLSDCTQLTTKFCFSKKTLTSAISSLTDVACQPMLKHVKEELTGALIPLADVLIHKDSLHLSDQWWQSLVVSVCRVQTVLVHIVMKLTSQLTSSARLLISPLSSSSSMAVEGKEVLRVEAIDAVERQSSMLETLLTKYDTSQNLQATDRYKLAQDLEDSIMDLSSYPLVTYALWRIISLLSKN